MSGNLDDFRRRLGGDVVVPGVTKSGGLTPAEALATRSWVEARRRKMASSGGRPTNADWTLKRLIPFTTETWQALGSIAVQWSSEELRFGPGQVAAFLVEAAVSSAPESIPDSHVKAPPATQTIDPKFDSWRQPMLFAGRAA